MTRTDLIEQARASLGPVGAFLGLLPDGPAIDVQQAGVRRLEQAGWRAVWTNEVVGADALVRASLWLAATERIVVGTCIANVWVRPAQTAHAAATQLVQAYPGRFVLGLGVGRPDQADAVGREFTSAVAVSRDYLAGVAEAGYPRVLAANGPRMLTVAAELGDGALPAGRPPDATADARRGLGADKLLIVYLPVTQDDPTGSVVDAVRAHRTAGADHVVVGMPYDTEFDAAVERMCQLRPGLDGS